MAKKKTKAKETETTLGRLSKAGEEALTRLVEELGKNERVTDAVGRAMSAKGKLDESAKRAVGGVGLAAAEELRELRTHIEKLEKRLAKLEADSKPAARSRTTKSRTTKPRTTTTRAKKPAASKPPESSSGETPSG